MVSGHSQVSSDSTTMSTRLSAPKPDRAVGAVTDNVVRLPIPDTDAALVACMRHDPERGQLELFDRFALDVERILCRILGPDPEIVDLMHDVFIAAITSIHSLRDDNALRSWLTGIAVHKARRLIRRRKIRRLVTFVEPAELPDHMVTSPSVEASDALRQTYRVLGKLPTDERIAFTLRQIDGMELAQIAVATGVSLATVKRRLSRAQRSFVALAREDDTLAEWVERGTLDR